MLATTLVALTALPSGGAPPPILPAPNEAHAHPTAAEPHFAPGALAASVATAPNDDTPGWDFSYTFVEIGATRVNLDMIDDEADTYYGTASIGLLDFLYVFLGYENSSTDFDDTDTDLWTLGAGVHFDAAERVDVQADIAWLYSDLTSDTLDEDSHGYQVRAGLRWMVAPFEGGGIELAPRALLVDLEDSIYSDDELLGFELEGRVHFLEHLSVGALYRKLEDDDVGALNARFSF